MTSSPAPPSGQRLVPRSERALLLLAIVALVSSIMLWWATHLSRTTFPPHIALSDNLQQVQRAVDTALLDLARHHIGEAINPQEIFTALDLAALKMRDCLEGRSSLANMHAVVPDGRLRQLLQTHAQNLDRLDHTVRALLEAQHNRDTLRLQQLKQFHELGQSGGAIETELEEILAQTISSKSQEQRLGIGLWLIFLLTTFFLLYRAARIESTHAQQEQIIHALLDATSDAIFVKDRAGRYLFCNQAAQQFIGKDASELLGRDDYHAFPAEDAAQLMAKDRLIMDSGTTSHHEEKVTMLRGQSMVFMVAKGVLRDHQRQVSGLFGIARDITQQRHDEEQLHHHRLLLQRTSRLAKVGGWEFDPQTMQGVWSEECARIHDLEYEERMNMANVLSFFQGEHRHRLEQALQKAIDTGTPYDLELELVTAKGVHKWIRTQCEPLMEKGQVRYIFGALQDITERKQAEEALLTSELALKKAQRLAEIGNWRWDLAKDIHTWSEETYRIYGMDPHLPPATYPEVQQFFTPESWQNLTQAIERCLREGRPYICDAEVIRPDDSRRWITVRGEALRSEDGTIQSLIGTIQDITERKQMEETLRDSELRFRTLFQQSMDAIAIMDRYPPKYRFVNPAFVELFGYTEEEIKKLTDEQAWILVHPDDRPIVQASLKERMEGRAKSARYEFRILRKDGDVRWVEVAGSVAELGSTLFNQTIYRDVTPRKQAEALQQSLQDQLTQAQKLESVGRLAGGVAHDFNNMLSVILGGLELVEEQVEPGSPIHDDLQEIKKAGLRSAELTQQLLAFARKQTVAPKVLDINSTVEGLLKMLRRLIGEDIDLVWAPDSELWPVHIDPSQVDQILANLCVNARDAINGPGKLTIETENVIFDATYCAKHVECVQGEYVLLAVSDNGCGMDRDTLNRVFEPFFTTKHMGEGTGLGLSMVYGIVRQNNGFIRVYSEPGHGTTFKIYLPRFGEAVEPEQGTTPLPAIMQGEGATILLVEDEKALLELNERMLLSLGYAVVATSTPNEAIRLATQHQGVIDLLLTDVVMPEMNGRELATELQRIAPHIRQVFMSGYTANVIAHHGVLDQGVHFLQKPFTKRDLATKLHAALAEPSATA